MKRYISLTTGPAVSVMTRCPLVGKAQQDAKIHYYSPGARKGSLMLNLEHKMIRGSNPKPHEHSDKLGTLF